MEEQFALVLVSLNPDSSDLSGFIYPKHGYIEARYYKPNNDIRFGFYGTLWGECRESTWLNPDPSAQWRVVRVEKNQEIVSLDPSQNFIKFHRGQVAYSGVKYSCAQYIMTNVEIKPDEMMGGKLFSIAKDDHLLAKGFESTAHTESAKSHAINVATKGKARASGQMSHAIALGSEGEAIATGDEGNAFAIYKAIAKGKRSHAVCTEDNGHVVVGKQGIAVALGNDCTAVGGEKSVLILAHKQGQRLRFAIGYVGEGLDAGVVYHLNESGFFEEVQSPAMVEV